jgi:hypothetical protein
MILGVFVALRGSLVIVECHAGADDIEHCRALVPKSGFDQRTKLFGISGK